MTAVLAGRRALVTGGSRGIGAEIVRRLAADGAALAFTYGSSAAEADKLAAEIAADGGTSVAIQADSGDPEQVARAIDETVAQLGGLDILVNNAGVAYIGDVESRKRNRGSPTRDRGAELGAVTLDASDTRGSFARKDAHDLVAIERSGPNRAGHHGACSLDREYAIDGQTKEIIFAASWNRASKVGKRGSQLRDPATRLD